MAVHSDLYYRDSWYILIDLTYHQQSRGYQMCYRDDHQRSLEMKENGLFHDKTYIILFYSLWYNYFLFSTEYTIIYLGKSECIATTVSIVLHPLLNDYVYHVLDWKGFN